MKINIRGGIACVLILIFLVGCTDKTIDINNLNEDTTEQTLVRKTEYGKVKGKAQNNNLAWLGVPYGGSTGGENRWKSPTKPEAWSDVRDATQAGDMAIQLGEEGVVGSEDALNLDIYAPNSNKKKLPVMVYIHGGNNQTSNAQEIDWSTFVQTQQVIVVSLNYRLGVLGFNPLLALKTGTRSENSGNYTLLDIHAGLQWVRGNIANFNGDSNNITVGGFSAGGRDIMAMLISPLFTGDFDKAVVFSGGLTLANEQSSQQTFAQALAPLVVEDGIKATEAEAESWLLTDEASVRSYLYALDAERMVPLMRNAGIRMEVFPHLYADGNVIPLEGFDTTQFNSVPLLVLSGEQEFSLFALSDPFFTSKDLSTDEEAQKEYTFVNKYGGNLYSLFNVKETITQISPNYESDIYAMEILFGEDPLVVGWPMRQLGSFHGVFIPLINAENNGYTSYIGNAYQELGAKELATMFKNYLGAFLKTGNPNKENDLPTWNNWRAQDANNILFIDASKEKASAIMGQKLDTVTSVLADMDEDNTLTTEQKETLITNVLNGRWFSSQLDEKYNVTTPFDKTA